MNTSATPQFPASLKWAQKMANLSDTAVRIPIIGVRLGLDFLVGLIPVAGDVVMLAVSLSTVFIGRNLGAPASLQKLMLRNVVLDFLIGLVPVLGDIFDIWFKANQRNVRLLERWWVEQNLSDIMTNTQAKLEEWEKEQS